MKFYEYPRRQRCFRNVPRTLVKIDEFPISSMNSLKSEHFFVKFKISLGVSDNFRDFSELFKKFSEL